MPIEQRECECGKFFLSARRGVILCSYCRRGNRIRKSYQRRAALEKSAPGEHTLKQWHSKIELQDGKCYWCHSKLLDDRGFFCGEKDHLIPLSRGGSQNIGNIVAACAPCNSEKHARTWREYAQLLLKRALPGLEFASTISTLPASKKAPSFGSQLNLLIAGAALAGRKRIFPDQFAVSRRDYLKAQAWALAAHPRSPEAGSEQSAAIPGKAAVDQRTESGRNRTQGDSPHILGVEKPTTTKNNAEGVSA